MKIYEPEVDMERKTLVKSRDMQALYEYRQWLRDHPRLTFLFVELTDRCNLHCIHCGSSCQAKGTDIDTQMLLEALETVAEDFPRGSVMVCVTGGEPLLHPDFFPIMKRVQELGFPWGMTTNGLLIDEDCARRLLETGLGSITISLDGLKETHDRFRCVEGAWEGAVRAVENLQRLSFPVQITTVVHRKNFQELEAMYEMVCDLQVESWRVINMEPIGRALKNKDLLLTTQEMKELLAFIHEKRYDPHTPMEVCFGCSHYLSFGYEHELRDNYFICGSGTYVGSILCNGDIFSCLDIERRPELIQGNIAKDRFSEVWKNRFQVFRADRSAFCRECQSCEERAFCGGDSTHTWDFDQNKPRFCILREEFL